MEADTVVKLILARAAAQPQKSAYHVKQPDNSFKAFTWGEYGNLIRQVAASLIKLGLAPHDKVAILSSTRFEWILASVGTQVAGGVSVGVYHTSSSKEIHYIVQHCEARVLFVENTALLDKLLPVRSSLSLLQHIVLFDGQAEGAMTWAEFLKVGQDVDAKDVQERLDMQKPEDVNTFIYTSGTTGPPKAVMLTNNNIGWTARALLKVTTYDENSTALAYLPLSHIAEQQTSINIAAISGCNVYFSEGMDKFALNMREVRPTHFFGVPRVWEKFYAGLQPMVPAGVPASALPSEVKKKMLAAVGMDNMRWAATGSAPINKTILQFFMDLGLHIFEVYGQSEDCGPTSFNHASKHKLGSAGPELPESKVRIADDGEILVYGPHVFAGYYKDPTTTAETITDGWLHSGDLGRVDEEGFLHITGRKKDILITAGGKNITPINIEASIKEHPLIGDCVVIGDARPYLIALIALDQEAATKGMKEKAEKDPGFKAGDLATFAQLPEVVATVQQHIDLVNADLAQVETIKRFSILPPFSIEKGEVTPTLKVKRAVVNRLHADEIERVYALPF